MVSENIRIPAGFRFASSEGSIKYEGRKDVGLIVADSPASAAAVFTRNTFAAAPVHYSQHVLEQSAGFVSGVVVNSGCANAATGKPGATNAELMGQMAVTSTDAKGPFLVCSTGTIGVQLPMDKLEKAIPAAGTSLAATPQAFIDFADSIMTTDTVRKVASRSFDLDGKTVTIAGCAKGSGMIHPNMATLLAFIVTDAEVETQFLRQIMKRITDLTLNCLTVDGDTSTNDTAILLTSGKSGVHIEPDSPALHPFETALQEVMTDLTRQLARDGEGATHLVEIRVDNAPTFTEARQAAMKIASSALVKTAIYGKDANWGRIACALGNSEVSFDPSKIDIRLGEMDLMVAGAPVEFDEDAALKILSEEEIKIFADLKAGQESATVWTCDLTERYVEINGAYRT